MQNKLFLKAADICELLEVKQTSAYEIIGNLNKELEEQGYLTLASFIAALFRAGTLIVCILAGVAVAEYILATIIYRYLCKKM